MFTFVETDFSFAFASRLWPSNALAHPRALTFPDLSQHLSVSHDANGSVTALGGACTSVGRGMRGSSFFVYKTDGHRHEDETLAQWIQKSVNMRPFCRFTTELSRGLEHEESGTSGHRRGDRGLRHEQYETRENATVDDPHI